MAFSLVITSYDGTSSTCSIIDSLRPMPYMYGTMKCRPGENVATYLPKRSIVYSRPCGTVTTPFHNVINANTTKMIAITPMTSHLFEAVRRRLVDSSAAARPSFAAAVSIGGQASDREGVVWGKRGSVRLAIGGWRK